MTATLRWIGLLATLILAAVIPLYAIRESGQQEQLLAEYQLTAVSSATDLYAENCVICHGATGEGIAVNTPLNSESVRAMTEIDLSKVISRGRDNTLMAAWGVEEGGVFSNSQVDQLVTLIQYVNWEYVAARVAELGLTPPQVVEMEVSDEMLAVLEGLPDSETISSGMLVYAENCAACHGNNGAGTVIAPALDSADLRTTPEDELIQLVNNGVPGTLMAGWENILAPEQLDSVIQLIYRWPELVDAGVEFPEADILQISSSPEMISAGAQLFDIACKSCHGVDAYGTRMAPALNNTLFLSKTPDSAIYQIIAAGVPGTLMPAWGSRLTDYDLQSLVAYLRSFEPTAPAIVPPILSP
jgi:mono/diheme cytochrome c family protein